MRRFALIAFALGAACAAARADDTAAAVAGESRAAASRLAEARKHVAAKKWGQAVALWQAVIDAPGSDLVAAEEGRLVAARRLAHAGLAKLPAKELERYRDKVEGQAKRWLAEGLRDDDDLALARVVEEAFVSRQAVDAADRLGDRAFLRGRFDEAEAWWRLIAPLRRAPGDGERLVYPDPPPAVAARLRAKQLLARLFRGEEGWEADLAAYRKRHPKASGQFAGRKIGRAHV